MLTDLPPSWPPSFALGLAGSACAIAAPLTAKTLVTLDRLSDPQVSPDGRTVAYDLRTVDFDANKSHHAIWLLDLADKAAPRRLVDPGGDATSARVGRRTASSSTSSIRAAFGHGARSGGMALAGGGATQVTHLPLEVGAFSLSPDGRRMSWSRWRSFRTPRIRRRPRRGWTPARRKRPPGSSTTGSSCATGIRGPTGRATISSPWLWTPAARRRARPSR